MIKNWRRAHLLLGLFVLAFGISWGGIDSVLVVPSVDLSLMQRPLRLQL
jgi:hypothetical protein